MPFEIVRNDVTKMQVDAIVNTANPDPIVGAGTDEAVHREAGPRLLAARKEIGSIEPGDAAATPGFNLPASYVLHAVSPAWIDGSHGELALLRKTYDAALELAVSLQCKSVAFPLLAAGSYGFPHDRALAVAIQAFTDFLLTHDMNIYLVVFNGEAFALAGSLFHDLKSYIDDRYVSDYAEKAQITPRPRERRKWLPHSNLSASLAPQSMQMAIPEEAADSLEDYLRNRESTFTEYLLDLLNERGEKDSLVYHRAGISRQLFNKIINKKNYQPTKNTAIQLAIGLQLDLPGTQKLLGKAGYALTRSSKADLVVQYYIERGIYSVVAINTALYDCGLPLLGTGTSA